MIIYDMRTPAPTGEDRMIDGKFAVAGTIKFFGGVSEERIREIVHALKPDWERRFPGTWLDSHTRPAGDDGSYLYAYTRVSDGSWDEGYGKAIMQSLRDHLGVDDYNRPIGVQNWNLGGSIKTV